MRKTSLLILLCLLPTLAFAAINIPNWVPQFAPEFRVSAFRPNDSEVRRIYTNRAALYDFDLNIRLKNKVWLWTGIGYFTKSGHDSDIVVQKYDIKNKCGETETVCKYQKTRLTLIPVTVGVKFYHCMSPYTDAFLGVGARWDFVRINNKGSKSSECSAVEYPGYKNHREYMVRRKSLGVAVIGGLRMILQDCIYVSPFAEYSNNDLSFWCTKNKTAQKIRDAGGYKIGMGAGVVL